MIKHFLAEEKHHQPEASQVLEHIAGPSLLVHHPVLSSWVFCMIMYDRLHCVSLY